MSERVGITECGDAGIDFSWEDELSLLSFAVLITKNVNDKFIEKILKYKDQVILHATITGMGDTRYEPKVPSVSWSHEQVKKLISLGFPANQIVLRVDPIIPNAEGIARAENVLKLFMDTGITRVKVSIMDMYKHVITRFEKECIPVPYYSFSPPYELVNDATSMLKKYVCHYSIETCAENMVKGWRTGCISKKDSDILGKDTFFYGKKGNRTGCLCPMNKSELLNNPKRCAHKCIYCYWQD